VRRISGVARPITGDTLAYVMISSGGGLKEANKFKKYYGAVDVKPGASSPGGLYGLRAGGEPADRTTLRGSPRIRTRRSLGGEVVHQLQLDGGPNRRRSALPSSRRSRAAGAFARYDYFDNGRRKRGRSGEFSPSGSTMPIPAFCMPNIWVNTYSTKPGDISRDADVALRLTVFYVYNDLRCRPRPHVTGRLVFSVVRPRPGWGTLSMEHTMAKLPKPRSWYTKFTKDYPEVARAYEKLGTAVHGSGPLNDKSRALVKLGISVGARLEGGVHSHIRKALAVGVTADEVRHAIILALPTIGLPSMMAALSWAEDILKE
jgi:alkylhydroperoxidase/carboxymuconolactone decarboxylase family protein YurZ